jgi:hypothetical protein
MFRTIVSAGLFLLALGCVSHGQTADKALTFDAASLKPATLPALDGSGRIAMAGPPEDPAPAIRAGFVISTRA